MSYQQHEQPNYGPPQSGSNYDNKEYGPQEGYNGNESQTPQPNFNTKPGSGETFDEQFKVEKPKLNDWPFTILFIAVCAGFLVCAGLGLQSYNKYKNFEGNNIYDSKNSFSLNTNTLILFSFVVVVGFVLAVLYYTMARMFTRQFIIITIILNLVWALGTAIYYLVEKYWSAGIVALVFALFSAFCYWTMRSRIPFATLVLKLIIDVTRTFPSTLIVSLIGSFVASAFGVLWSAVMVAVYVKYHPDSENPACSEQGGCSNGKLIGLMVFITFAGFYISEVIKNVIHTTICGVYGSWYYCYKSDQGMPRHPAMSSFKRSMTYSFGSISFGSLIVAFINLIRQILSALRNANAQDGGNVVISILLCLADCIIGFIDWLVQFFNHYAYSYIALYGKAYIPAARETWFVMKKRGIDALVNDSLIGNVLSFGSTFVGFATALFGYLFLRLTHPAYNSTGGYYPIIVGFSFLVGTQICSITTVSITSGVATFFVAVAKDPEVFHASYPDIYEQLCNVYPPAREKLNLH